MKKYIKYNCNIPKQRSRTDTRSNVERYRLWRDGTTLENKGTQSRMQSRMRPNLKCLTLEMPNSNYPQRPQRREQRTEPQSRMQRRAARNVQGQRTANDSDSRCQSGAWGKLTAATGFGRRTVKDRKAKLAPVARSQEAWGKVSTATRKYAADGWGAQGA